MPGNFLSHIIDMADRQRQFAPDGFLFHQGDPVTTIFIVTQGLIELTRHQLDGRFIILQRAVANTFLADASVYSKVYHCDGIAREPSKVFELSRQTFLDRLAEDQGFSTLWANHLASEVQSARYRSEILSLKTVGQRLDGWLTWHGGELPEKGQWKSIASQIGVSPEALYRELAKRRSS